MLMLKSDFKRGLVPLAERGTTVWTSPLTQDQAEEDSQRKEEYGTHDPQTGEIILQHADPAQNNIHSMLRIQVSCSFYL